MGDSREFEFEFDARLGRVWREDHRYLLNVAFRALGSISEAEDAVQEARRLPSAHVAQTTNTETTACPRSRCNG